MHENEPFGKMLRRIRREKKLRLADVADELGVSVPYLSGIERGSRKLTNSRLFELAEALKTAPGPLFRAAAEARGYFALETEGVGDHQKELGAWLQFHWDALQPEHIAELREAVDRISRK